MRKPGMSSYVFAVPAIPSVPVVGQAAQFPVHRIYCVGRNYEEHAKEMGFTGREPPFFFMKPADAVLVATGTEATPLPYPQLTQDLHHEIELVVAIGEGGRNIAADDAARHIYGYAVGLDMTRRDLQGEMKKQGRPWCIGKGFDASAPISPITPAAQAGAIDCAIDGHKTPCATARSAMPHRRSGFAGHPQHPLWVQLIASAGL